MLHCKLSGHVWKSENASSGQLPYSWSLTPPMAEGFEFLRVRETGTKGSSFWRRSTKRRRVRLFARERDGDKGFEFSEPKTRFKISDSSGAPKASFPYTRGNQKTSVLVNFRTIGL